MISENDPRVKQCAFAKLQGVASFPEPGYFLVKKYEVLLGRKSKSSSLDIVLGDNMNISRKHVKLEYNFSVGAFELIVLGKNGATVDNVLYTPTSPPLRLKSQDRIQIGETIFHFLLPKEYEAPAPKPSKKRSHPSSAAAAPPSAKHSAPKKSPLKQVPKKSAHEDGEHGGARLHGGTGGHSAAGAGPSGASRRDASHREGESDDAECGWMVEDDGGDDGDGNEQEGAQDGEEDDRASEEGGDDDGDGNDDNDSGGQEEEEEEEAYDEEYSD
mmetsp:Transcript_2431/g.6278  ORF Transcript_2431/g.6278 Transcript_2431/m.6278 type:complete len:272 (+) Transcript_2431:183-998(+)